MKTPSETRNRRLRAPTMDALCDRFMAEHARVHCKPNTARNYDLLFDNHIRPRLGMFKIEDIRRSDIADFHHSMKETPYQANRALAALSKMFNTAELLGPTPRRLQPLPLGSKIQRKSQRAVSVASRIDPSWTSFWRCHYHWIGKPVRSRRLSIAISDWLSLV